MVEAVGLLPASGFAVIRQSVWLGDVAVPANGSNKRH